MCRSAVGVAGQERQNSSETHPPRPASVERREQRCGVAEILERELEEQRLADRAVALLANRFVVDVPVLDGMIEDRRVRRQPDDRALILYRCSGPLVSSPRVMLSSHRRCPSACRLILAAVFVAINPGSPIKHGTRLTRRMCRRRQNLLIAGI